MSYFIKWICRKSESSVANGNGIPATGNTTEPNKFLDMCALSSLPGLLKFTVQLEKKEIIRLNSFFIDLHSLDLNTIFLRIIIKKITF